MDVLYGIDNPLFMDLKKDPGYLFRTLFPWLFKFLFTIRKINKLNEPIYPYLARFTDNTELIDNIAQHFFKETPTSFALSYFSLYNDYNYPVGGTGMLPAKMEEFSREHGADLHLKTFIVEVNPEEKYVIDNHGKTHSYDSLIWACDLKTLYNSIHLDNLNDEKLKSRILARKEELKELKGAESVFTTYLTVQKEPAYFGSITTGHCFYTPRKEGLSVVGEPGDDKESIKNYLRDFVKYNTFEISIPALRDPSLSPEGETALEVSLLFDYTLTKKIVEEGWKRELKHFVEELILEQMYALYPEMEGKIIKQFSSTPLTVERYTSNTEGAIVGWSFANPHMPVVDKFLDVAKSINTPIKGIYKAGQWAYSPAGVPISIMTGKMAADKVIKKH
jgi:phytoene dehydrogenase-like protein